MRHRWLHSSKLCELTTFRTWPTRERFSLVIWIVVERLSLGHCENFVSELITGREKIRIRADTQDFLALLMVLKRASRRCAVDWSIECTSRTFMRHMKPELCRSLKCDFQITQNWIWSLSALNDLPLVFVALIYKIRVAFLPINTKPWPTMGSRNNAL